MCDNRCDACASNDFYQHYRQQHAIMMQYFQQMTNLDTFAAYGGTSFSGIHNSANVSYNSSESSSCSSCSSSSDSSTSYSSEYEEQQEEEQYEEEDDESEYEYELNVDAILAMRAAKEKLKKASSSESDSVVMIDSDKEDFEFVDYGSIQTLGSKIWQPVGDSTDKTAEERNHKIFMDYLYGDKSAAIAGLETAMAVDFDHLCDNHQPALWPVLPLRL